MADIEEAFAPPLMADVGLAAQAALPPIPHELPVPDPHPEGMVIRNINDQRQRVGYGTWCGKVLGNLGVFYGYLVNIPYTSYMMFILVMTVALLGIVPGVLNIIGHQHAGDVVSVIAGSMALVLALVTLMRPVWLFVCCCCIRKYVVQWT